MKYKLNGNTDKEVEIDEESLSLIAPYRWYLTPQGYAQTNINRKSTPMHRLIMGTPKGKDTDHINGNRLDNRKSNLRICSRQENNRYSTKLRTMTSKFKGVRKDRTYWRAQYSFNKKTVHIGYFKTEEQAAKAYDKIVKQLYGEFAKLNF